MSVKGADIYRKGDTSDSLLMKKTVANKIPTVVPTMVNIRVDAVPTINDFTKITPISGVRG